MAGDFQEPKADPVTGVPGPIPAAEAMLAYVTVTRAMGRLDNAGLAWVHSHPAAKPSHDEATGHGRAVAADVETPASGVDRAEASCHPGTAVSVRAQAPAASHPAEPIVPPAGTVVRVRGLRGEWTVRGRGADGSVTLTGGPSGQWRSVTANRLVNPARRPRRTTGTQPVPAAAETAGSPTI